MDKTTEQLTCDLAAECAKTAMCVRRNQTMISGIIQLLIEHKYLSQTELSARIDKLIEETR